MAHESHDYKATAAKLRELAHQVQSDYCRDRLLRMAQGFRQAAKHAEWRLAAPREAISPGLKVGAAGCRVDRGEGARRSFLYGLAHRAADRFRGPDGTLCRWLGPRDPPRTATARAQNGCLLYARGIALLWLRLPTLRYRGCDWGLSVATALLTYGWSLRQRGADSKHVALNVR